MYIFKSLIFAHLQSYDMTARETLNIMVPAEIVEVYCQTLATVLRVLTRFFGSSSFVRAYSNSLLGGFTSKFQEREARP